MNIHYFMNINQGHHDSGTDVRLHGNKQASKYEKWALATFYGVGAM